MTKYAETLEACKVPPEHISSWAIEPWSYNNVKECTKWIKMRLEPKLEAYLRIVNKYSPEAWQRLLLMNPSNNAFAILRKYAGEVREEWYKRPRFQDEKGRVDRVGY